ncbi:hypothetical protein MAM1_0094d04993 [Mucor ambiguus]|uniref:Uncharacterized protein n=1 Tax=Mucor ambiguus TaxID=91626 RepID=A0A0C9MQE9_9FUNG|nr:hypothetical protein MAM1_0094d04993 [Mucor ambiguus]
MEKLSQKSQLRCVLVKKEKVDEHCLGEEEADEDTDQHMTKRHLKMTLRSFYHSHAADKAAQEDTIMLVKLSQWVPVVYSHDNMPYGMLTTSSMASIVSSKNQTTGTQYSLTNDNNNSSKEVMETDASHFDQHLKITRTFDCTSGAPGEENSTE